jgi:hypothetical protein
MSRSCSIFPLLLLAALLVAPGAAMAVDADGDGYDDTTDCDGEIDEDACATDTEEPTDAGEPTDEPTPDGCASRGDGVTYTLLLPFVFLGVRRRW